MTRIMRLAGITAAGLLLTVATAAAGQAHQPEPVVKNAPYSGEGVTTVKLTMFDGTKIERTVTARFHRDSAGRVRREQTVVGLEALDPTTDFRAVVTIIDPVGDVIYTLNPGTRTAERLLLSSLTNLHTGPATPAGWQTRVEALGTKDVDGLTAIGSRTITTIPAGQAGNDRPIEIIDERWESTALKVLLRSLHRDPRSGDVEYALTKVSRGEPPASMFTVPVGYTIRIPSRLRQFSD